MTRKIPKEVKELGGIFLPWIEMKLDGRDEPTKGLRLSQDCGACCILDYILDKPSVVNDGVNMIGHIYAEIFIKTLIAPHAEVVREKEYQWASKGISGMDAIVDTHDNRGWRDTKGSESPYLGHYELKTSSEENPKPKSYNRRQVIRQRVAMARHYGITDAELFNSYIFIVGKSGRQSGKVFGPFLIEPTEEELKIAQDDIDLRVEVYEDIVEDGLEDPYEHPLLRELRYGTCTRCFPLEAAEPSDDLKDLLDTRDNWDDWVEGERLTKWQKDIKDKVKPLVPLGEKQETEYFLVRHTEGGRLYLDAKNLN